MLFFQRMFRKYILPNMVIILLLVIWIIGVYLIKFYSTYNEEDKFRYFSHSVAPDQFTIITDLDFGAHIFAASKNISFTFNSFEIIFKTPIDKDLKTFCLNQGYFLYSTDEKPIRWSEDILVSTPICLDMSSYQYSEYDNHLYYSIPISDITSLTESTEITYNTYRNYFPIDTLETNIALWVDYKTVYNDGSTQAGFIPSYIDLNSSGNLPLTEFTLSTQETTKELLIEKGMGLPVVYQGGKLLSYYYTAKITRPFIIQLLFVAVLTTVTGFLVVTFFIRDTQIFLASILVFLFGINNLKQILPLPTDLAGKVGILDILLPIYYLLIGVSGINFLLIRYLRQDIYGPPRLVTPQTVSPAPISPTIATIDQDDHNIQPRNDSGINELKKRITSKRNPKPKPKTGKK